MTSRRCASMRLAAAIPVIASTVGFVPGCGGMPIVSPQGPFPDAPAVPLDGRMRNLPADIVALGPMVAGDVLRIEVMGESVDGVLVFSEDVGDTSSNTALLAGGGPANAPFLYHVRESGQFFVFSLLGPMASSNSRGPTIAVTMEGSMPRPPTRQTVEIVFEEGFLTEPGLIDPISAVEADRRLLADLSETVQGEIVARLRTIFDGTPIDIFESTEPQPPGPVSRLVFRAARVEASDQTILDAALPPPDPTRPECQARVVFGEVLPRGVRQDLGNQVLDDEAVVYVGSFQGRGADCRTAVTDSLNNIVLTLAQTAAHEIGHLVGLVHVEQATLMNRSATLAFQRELAFERGQVQIERTIDETETTEVLTSLIQSPAFYFRAVFGGP